MLGRSKQKYVIFLIYLILPFFKRMHVFWKSRLKFEKGRFEKRLKYSVKADNTKKKNKFLIYMYILVYIGFNVKIKVDLKEKSPSSEG